MRYRTAGRGSTTVIFVPGWTMSCEVFAHQLAHFADSSDYRALSYDPRAQGRSTQTANGHYYEQHARDLRALITALELSRVVLVGWSAGGVEVLEYLRLYGHNDVAGVVILDIPPRFEGMTGASSGSTSALLTTVTRTTLYAASATTCTSTAQPTINSSAHGCRITHLRPT
jgi:pimeloyl-ACP methyl ester carboxylesterase